MPGCGPMRFQLRLKQHVEQGRKDSTEAAAEALREMPAGLGAPNPIGRSRLSVRMIWV